jgi:hypothetical protein
MCIYVLGTLNQYYRKILIGQYQVFFKVYAKIHIAYKAS